MPLWQVQKMLSGDAGSIVSLKMIRQGQNRTVDLELRAVAPPIPVVEEREDVTWLRVPYFDGTTAESLRSTLSEMATGGATKLLLDLRGSYGSSASYAYGVADLFAAGRFGSLVQRGEVVETYDGTGDPTWTGRLVVLVDRGSIGPAEVLASVLRQSAGAQLVGEVSFGYAGRRALAELSDGARLLFTDAYYTGPDGDPIDEGLEPDILVRRTPRTFSQDSVPLEDRILERGLEILAAPTSEEERQAA